ncbi:MAG: Response regulator rcp1 [Nitrospira sp.]|nr:Response regulator rcp1 [Nitrospira sp.]
MHMTTHPSILLIDDSPGEQELFRLALTQAGLGVTLYTEQATDAALHWLEHRVPYSLNHSLSAAEGSVAATHVERGPSATAHSASTVAIPPAAPPLPALILLDLNLCAKNGCDLLKRLRSDTRFAALPVVIFTTSDDPDDLAVSYSCGANGYIVKPSSFNELVRCITDLCAYWLIWNRPSMRDIAC